MTLICVTKSFLINDVIYIDDPVNGKIKSSLYLEQLGNLERGWCEFDKHFGIFYNCDFETLGRLCTVLMNFTQKEINTFIAHEEPSLRRYGNGAIIKKTLHYLLCGDFGKITERENVDFIVHDPPKLLCTYKNEYSDYVHVTALLYEHDIDYVAYLTFVKIVETQFTKKTTYNTSRIIYHSTYIMSLFSNYTCLDNYTGYHCWYYCVETPQQYCTCIQINVTETVCVITCKPGYSYRYFSYKVGDTRQIMKKCDIIDICGDFLRTCIYFCLIKGNGTFYCEQPSFWMLSNFNKGQNISSPVFYYGEVLFLQPSFKNFSLEFQLNHHFVVMVFDDENFIPAYENYYKKSFKPNEINFTKVNLKVKESILIQYSMIFIDWDINIKYRTYFHFFYPLIEISIINTKTQETLSTHILLGDSLNCNSSAYPYYAVVYAWASSIITFTFPLYQDQKLNQKLIPSRIKLRCTAHLLVPERPMMIVNETLSLSVKVFYNFGWSTNKRVFYSNKSVNCSVYTNLGYNITIYEVEHDRDVEITDNIISFTQAAGDAYSFYCILITEYNFVYSRYATFYILQDPSCIALYLFTYVTGAVIQCGHDGYFEDYYIINVYLFFYNPGVKLIDEDNRTVRVPFNAIISRYEIVCTIKNAHTHENILNSSTFINLTRLYEKNYTVTENCVVQYPSIEVPPIVTTYGNDTVLMAHSIFYHSITLNDLAFYLSVSLSTSIMYLIAIIVFHVFYFQTRIREDVAYEILKIRLRVYRVYMDYRLFRIVNDLIKEDQTGHLISLYLIKEKYRF